jgi:DNA-binding transcriptional ArsR family regulator
VEKAVLERYLAEGLSLERIGALIDRHPTTVAYWLQKHGLTAVNRDKYAPKGGLARNELEPLIAEGLSLREIGDRLGVSISTVRHWLCRYGLRTLTRAGPDRPDRIRRRCRRHGMTTFVAQGKHRYYRCRRCRSEDVAARRRRVKAILVSEAGGRCMICGYDTHPGALEFHHLDPARKEFELSLRGVTRSIARIREEARKCVLLCANCHAEVEGGVAELPLK